MNYLRLILASYRYGRALSRLALLPTTQLGGPRHLAMVAEIRRLEGQLAD